MSHDRIRFHLVPKYFRSTGSASGMTQERCEEVLLQAFGMLKAHSAALMRDNPRGFQIVCRPSQFGRFIVIRNEIGNCINGISDLAPEIFIPEDKLQVIADRYHIAYNVMKRIHRDIIQRDTVPVETDVSGNSHRTSE